MLGPGSPMLLGSKPYGASARDVPAGLGKNSPSHEQFTVVRLGADGKGTTSAQEAASPHTPPSEQLASRTCPLSTERLLEAQACTCRPRTVSGAWNSSVTVMSAPLCTSSQAGSSVSSSDTNPMAALAVSKLMYGPSGAEQDESVVLRSIAEPSVRPMQPPASRALHPMMIESTTITLPDCRCSAPPLPIRAPTPRARQRIIEQRMSVCVPR